MRSSLSRRFVAAVCLLAAGPAYGQSLLETNSPSLTTYLPASATPVQNLRPGVLHRGVNLDGTARSPAAFEWHVGANPFPEDWNSNLRQGEVRLDIGAYEVDETDLSFPSSGIAWVIGRTYNPVQRDGSGRTDSNGYQGWNWAQSSQPEIGFVDDADDSKDLVYLVYGADRFLEFRRIMSGGNPTASFRGVNGAAGAVTFEADANGPDTYIYHDQVGNRIAFFGFDGAAAPAQGQLWTMTDPAGAVAYVGSTTKSQAISAGYDAEGRITTAFDAEGRRYSYTYQTLESVKRLTQVKAEVNSGSWTEIGRVDYTYYTSADSDIANGSPGDLKLVATLTPLSGSSQSLRKVTYYRYWKGTYHATTNPGYPHQLRLVVGPEGTRRFDWNDPGQQPQKVFDDGFLGATYEALNPYALASLTAYEQTTGRLKSAWFNGECGCSGGVSGTYGYAYADNATDPRQTAGYQNAWCTRTVVTPPVTSGIGAGAYTVQYFDEAGQPLSRVLTEGDPAQSPTKRWSFYVERDADGMLVRWHSPRNLRDGETARYDHATGSFDPIADRGLVVRFQRVASGSLKGLLEARMWMEGDSAQNEYAEWSVTYTSASKAVSADYSVLRPLVASRSRYTTTSPTSGVNTTDYVYSFHSGEAALVTKSVETRLPVVSTANNGPGGTAQDTTIDYLRTDGTLAFRRERDGVLTYTRVEDGLVSLSIDDANTSASDIASADNPGTVWGKTIASSYNALGQLQTVTQKDASAAVLNQVKFLYDGWGNVAKTQQDHDSTVGGTHLYDVAYSYAKAAVAGTRHTVRRTGMTLPDGTPVGFDYLVGTSNSVEIASILNDELSRVRRVTVGSTPSPVAKYEYLGRDQLAGVDYPQPGVVSNRFGATFGQYPSLDAFDRPIVDAWTKSGAPDIWRENVTYDHNSNIDRLVDEVLSGHDVDFTMDGLDRLTKAEEGTWSGNAITSRTRQEIWTLTQTGNWSNHKLDRNGNNTFTDDGDLDETGTFNTVNEVTQRDLYSNGQQVKTPTHDRVGNMTDDGEAFKNVYDPFGRLTKVVKRASPSLVVAQYTYDGMGQLIAARSDTNGNGSVTDEPTERYVYDARWRIVAVYVTDSAGTSTAIKERYVRHNAGLDGLGCASYIDEIILRDRDVYAPATLEERVYYCQNAHHDVSALVDAGGTVLERVKYWSYGMPRVYPRIDADWDQSGKVDKDDLDVFTAKWEEGDPDCDLNGDGDVNEKDLDLFNEAWQNGWTVTDDLSIVAGNRFGYTGHLWDKYTRKYHARHRVYDAARGRFLNRDPMEYDSGTVNIYEYVHGGPRMYVDPFGLEAEPPAKAPKKGPPPKPDPRDMPVNPNDPYGIDRICERGAKACIRDKVKEDNPGFHTTVETIQAVAEMGVELNLACCPGVGAGGAADDALRLMPGKKSPVPKAPVTKTPAPPATKAPAPKAPSPPSPAPPPSRGPNTNPPAPPSSKPPYQVTPDGVVIPPDPKYKIPSDYIQNPHRPGSYGITDPKTGKFCEKLRIDPATPPGKKGPNYPHYHRPDHPGEHLSPRPGDKDPGFSLHRSEHGYLWWGVTDLRIARQEQGEPRLLISWRPLYAYRRVG